MCMYMKHVIRNFFEIVKQRRSVWLVEYLIMLGSRSREFCLITETDINVDVVYSTMSWRITVNSVNTFPEFFSLFQINMLRNNCPWS